MPGIFRYTDYKIRYKMDVVCINDDSHTFRMCNVSFGGTKMNRDSSGFNLSNKNQLKRTIRNNRTCSRGLRKFSDSSTNLTHFENISYFSRHDVNTYK